MDFKTWLEMSDIRTADTSSVNLEPNYNYSRYNYTFKYKNEEYRVEFRKSNRRFGIDSLQDIYSVDFSGPNDNSLTGTAGSGASVVYTQLLLAVKKLLETVEVNGLAFSAADDFMNLVYDRFYKQFLKKDFLRVSDVLYLRKDYIKELHKHKHPEEIDGNYRGIIAANREYAQNVKSLKDEKAKMRLAKRSWPTLPGKFVYVTHYPNTKRLLYVIRNSDKPGWSIATDSGLYPTAYNSINFDLTMQPKEADVRELLQAYARSAWAYRNKPEFMGLRAFFPKYGIVSEFEDERH